MKYVVLAVVLACIISNVTIADLHFHQRAQYIISMKRIFAIFAMLLTVGLFNGANACSANGAGLAAVQIDASRDQFVSSADYESDCGDEQCFCWDMCFCGNHCHHCGGSSIYISLYDINLVPKSSSAFEATSDNIAFLALTYVLIDPPRA